MDLPISLYGLVGPFLVWPIELLVPYSFIVEELYKYLVVVFILKHTKVSQEGLGSVLTAGLLFALSETALYTLQINAYGSIALVFTRLIYTTLLHSLTFLIIYTLAVNKKTKLAGLFAAMLIHFLYNLYI